MVNQPNKVVLHCSASPDFFSPQLLFDSVGVKQIDAWHRLRHFEKIGYHLVIRRTGVIENGREFSEIGAHCIGQNAQSIGVCWVGTLIPTQQQWEALIQVYKNLKKEFGFTPDQWHPHNEYANKICPGIDIKVVRDLFKESDTEPFSTSPPRVLNP